MFELEIMVTGYTIVVVATTVVISKCIGNKKLKKISDELYVSKINLLNAEDEIKQLKKKIQKEKPID